MKKIIIFLLVLSGTLFAVEGVETLLLPMNARIASIGEAYVAVPTDLSAVNGNTAGLAWTGLKGFTGSYSMYMLDMSYFSLGGSYPLQKNQGVVSAYLNTFNYGSIDNYVSGVLDGNFDSSDFAFNVSYNKELKYGIYGGVNGKYLSRKINPEITGKVYALDLNFFLKQPFYILMKKNNMKNVDVGVSIKNLGSGQFAESSISLPLRVVAGFAYHNIIDKKKNFTFMADAIYSVADSTTKFNLGGEYSIRIRNDIIALIRAGYMVNVDNGFRVGVGLNYKQYRLNYALLNKGDLGYTHIVGIDYVLEKALNASQKAKDDKIQQNSSSTNETSQQNSGKVKSIQSEYEPPIQLND